MKLDKHCKGATRVEADPKPFEPKLASRGKLLVRCRRSTVGRKPKWPGHRDRFLHGLVEKALRCSEGRSADLEL